MVTGRPFMASKRPLKSDRCMGSSLVSAFSRASVVLARIICCTMGSRSSAKNMCSVRQRPMPSAPNCRAILASRGMSALVRTPSVRTSSAHFMSVPKSPLTSGSLVGTLPRMTRPVPPSMVMKSPSFTVYLPTIELLRLEVHADGLAAGDAGLAHAAGDHGRVGRHAAARRQDALGRVHAVDVVGRGLGRGPG